MGTTLDPDPYPALDPHSTRRWAVGAAVLRFVPARGVGVPIPARLRQPALPVPLPDRLPVPALGAFLSPAAGRGQLCGETTASSVIAISSAGPGDEHERRDLVSYVSTQSDSTRESELFLTASLCFIEDGFAFGLVTSHEPTRESLNDGAEGFYSRSCRHILLDEPSCSAASDLVLKFLDL